MSLKKRTDAQYDTDPNLPFIDPAPPLPVNMMVELTNGCNHACSFCPNPYMERGKGRVDTDLLYRIMEEAVAGGVREIGFYTTGEPFVHKDLAKFTAHAKKIGFTYAYISTNGALASPDRSQAVIDAGMDSIKFSINAGSRDTYNEIHGKDDWDAVIENLRLISAYRRDHAPHVRLYITCVVTKTIEHEIADFEALFSPLVDEIDFVPCAPMAWPEAAVSGDGGICHMPFNRLHVTYEGYLTLCCVDFQNYLAVADLNELSLEDAWHAPAFREIRGRHIKGRLEGTLCGRCWHGNTEPVEPLVKDYSDYLDHDAYERHQEETVLKELRVSETP